MKKALAADGAVKKALTNFTRIQKSAGYKFSNLIMRKFVTAYTSAIDLYAPAIKKNDKKLVKKANDALSAATALFSKWGEEFGKDATKLSS